MKFEKLTVLRRTRLIKILQTALLLSLAVFAQAEQNKQMQSANDKLEQASDASKVSAANTTDAKASALLVHQLEPLDSMQGLFEQTITDSDGKLLQKTAGEFKVKRPGHFYWKTTQPYDQLLITDNVKLWQYDGDLEQATVQAFDQKVGNTPALLLSGETAKIQAEFHITQEPSTKGDQFILKPKGKDGLFQTLKILFINGNVSAMEFIDSLGQKTALAFKQMEINPVLDKNTFVFTPPPGVDVIVEE